MESVVLLNTGSGLKYPETIDCHLPRLLPEDNLPGMILCIEAGCFGSDLVWFGNMPEDIFLVTENGLELLGVDLPRDVLLCG